MTMQVQGVHHVTAIAGDPRRIWISMLACSDCAQ